MHAPNWIYWKTVNLLHEYVSCYRYFLPSHFTPNCGVFFFRLNKQAFSIRIEQTKMQMNRTETKKKFRFQIRQKISKNEMNWKEKREKKRRINECQILQKLLTTICFILKLLACLFWHYSLEGSTNKNIAFKQRE